jgi:hypothetical protein
MEHLVALDTAGLSDDALHVLNLALTADEGTELSRYVSIWIRWKIVMLVCCWFGCGTCGGKTSGEGRHSAGIMWISPLRFQILTETERIVPHVHCVVHIRKKPSSK